MCLNALSMRSMLEVLVTLKLRPTLHVFLHGKYYSLGGAASRALNYLHNGHLFGQVGHLRQQGTPAELHKWGAISVLARADIM